MNGLYQLSYLASLLQRDPSTNNYVVKMEKIPEKYKCKKVLDQIADYIDVVSEFCNDFWLNVCYGLSLSLSHTSQPLTCEKEERSEIYTGYFLCFIYNYIDF